MDEEIVKLLVKDKDMGTVSEEEVVVDGDEVEILMTLSVLVEESVSPLDCIKDGEALNDTDGLGEVERDELELKKELSVKISEKELLDEVEMVLEEDGVIESEPEMDEDVFLL